MLATQIAGKILQREISADDQQRLLEESLRELQAARRN
jgi:F0F1-type ATP synthase membrane subunit b/b'